MKKTAGRKRAPGGGNNAANKTQERSAKDRKRESDDIERAVYDGMQDLRAEKPK